MVTYLNIVLLIAGIQSQCIKLADSKQCPEYKEFSVNLDERFKNVAEFDAFVVNKGMFDNACPDWRVAKDVPIRNSISFTCGYAVYRSGCNQGLESKYVGICPPTLQAAKDDLLKKLQTSCKMTGIWPEYDKYVTDSKSFKKCYVGVGSEASKASNLIDNPGAAGAVTKTATSSAGPSSVTVTEPSMGSTTAVLTSAQDSAVTPSSTPSPKAPQSSPANSSSTSKDEFNPLYIAAAAIGIAVVAILGTALYFMFKRKPEDRDRDIAPSNNYNDAPPAAAPMFNSPPPVEGEETLEVAYEYISTLFDEITLNVGDQILVKARYDDGWGLGTNLSTGAEGTFPLVCLAPVGYQRDSQYSKHDSSFSKRSSSVYVEGQGYGQPNYQSGNYPRY
ncbi:hypothetical protein BC833DRAFT_594435 [Globomyces pollinis-pini]|nr:hypothetical protein BC833DRAFT_594435 [Globomyces pollinis-pini]